MFEAETDPKTRENDTGEKAIPEISEPSAEISEPKVATFDHGNFVILIVVTSVVTVGLCVGLWVYCKKCRAEALMSDTDSSSDSSDSSDEEKSDKADQEE